MSNLFKHLTGVHKNLEPVSVGDDTEDEVLVVEAKLANSKVRQINAYGPQEDTKEELRKSFFNKLDEEVKKAKLSGALVCLELDANSKILLLEILILSLKTESCWKILLQTMI